MADATERDGHGDVPPGSEDDGAASGPPAPGANQTTTPPAAKADFKVILEWPEFAPEPVRPPVGNRRDETPRRRWARRLAGRLDDGGPEVARPGGPVVDPEPGGDAASTVIPEDPAAGDAAGLGGEPEPETRAEPAGAGVQAAALISETAESSDPRASDPAGVDEHEPEQLALDTVSEAEAEPTVSAVPVRDADPAPLPIGEDAIAAAAPAPQRAPATAARRRPALPTADDFDLPDGSAATPPMEPEPAVTGTAVDPIQGDAEEFGDVLDVADLFVSPRLSVEDAATAKQRPVGEAARILARRRTRRDGPRAGSALESSTVLAEMPEAPAGAPLAEARRMAEANPATPAAAASTGVTPEDFAPPPADEELAAQGTPAAAVVPAAQVVPPAPVAPPTAPDVPAAASADPQWVPATPVADAPVAPAARAVPPAVPVADAPGAPVVPVIPPAATRTAAPPVPPVAPAPRAVPPLVPTAPGRPVELPPLRPVVASAPEGAPPADAFDEVAPAAATAPAPLPSTAEPGVFEVGAAEPLARAIPMVGDEPAAAGPETPPYQPPPVPGWDMFDAVGAPLAGDASIEIDEFERLVANLDDDEVEDRGRALIGAMAGAAPAAAEEGATDLIAHRRRRTARRTQRQRRVRAGLAAAVALLAGAAGYLALNQTNDGIETSEVAAGPSTSEFRTTRRPVRPTSSVAGVPTTAVPTTIAAAEAPPTLEEVTSGPFTRRRPGRTTTTTRNTGRGGGAPAPGTNPPAATNPPATDPPATDPPATDPPPPATTTTAAPTTTSTPDTEPETTTSSSLVTTSSTSSTTSSIPPDPDPPAPDPTDPP